MMHELIKRLVLIAPSVKVVYSVRGDKPVYLFHGLNLVRYSPEICSPIVEISTRDLGKETQVEFKNDLCLSSRHDFMRDLMHGLASMNVPQMAQLMPVDTVDTSSSLLDEEVVYEIQKFHSLSQASDTQLQSWTGSLVGVHCSKSDRFWKNGQVSVSCGIAATTRRQTCRLLSYDHNGILYKTADSVIPSLEKGSHVCLRARRKICSRLGIVRTEARVCRQTTHGR